MGNSELRHIFIHLSICPSPDDIKILETVASNLLKETVKYKKYIYSEMFEMFEQVWP